MKISYLMDKRVCVWGTGYNSRQVYSYLKTDYKIYCFYDNDESRIGHNFFGIPVKKWNGKRNEDEIIVIASCYWREITEQLTESGLRIFRDFIPQVFLYHNRARLYREFFDIARYCGTLTREDWRNYKKDKRLLVFHGSCHSELLGALVGIHPEIQKNYKIICAPTRWLLMFAEAPKEEKACAEAYCVDKGLFEETDVFIYQEKPDGYEETDLDAVLHKLNGDCRRIRISNLNFAGYFIQCRRNKDWTRDSLMYCCRYKDYYVDKLLQEGLTEKEIIKAIKREDFIPKERILKMVSTALENVRWLDRESDVKIYDFIEANYKKEQLYYDPAHPTHKVMVEYADRIIQCILPECQTRLENISSEEDTYMVYLPLKGTATVVYPCVIKALGMENYKKRFSINFQSGFSEFLTFDEYIEEYIHITQKRRD